MPDESLLRILLLLNQGYVGEYLLFYLHGQETYEFGSSTQDARHFDKYVLKVLQEDAEILSELFNSEEK